MTSSDKSKDPVPVRQYQNKGLSGDVLIGMTWLAAQTVANRFIGLISQLILAWVIEPQAFGIVGLAIALTNISSVVTNFGIEELLVQRGSSFILWAKSAQVVSSSLSIISFTLTVCVGYVGSLYYGDVRIFIICLLTGIASPIASTQLLPSVQLRLNLNFRTIATINSAENLSTQLAIIALAFLGFKEYSFVIPLSFIAAGKSCYMWSQSCALNRRLSDLREVRIKEIIILLNNGTLVFLTRVCMVFVSQGDYIVLGFFASASAVGYYFFAYKIALQPLWLLAGNITNVLYPTLTRLRFDPSRQLEAAKRSCRALSYLIFPACLVQAVISDPGLRFLFGNKWQHSIPIVQIISVGAGFDAISWVAGSFLQVNREYITALRLISLFTAIFFGFVVLGAYAYQAIGVALGISIYFLIVGTWMTIKVFYPNGGGLIGCYRLLFKPALLSFISFGPLYFATTNFHDVERLIIVPSIALLFYVILIWFFDKDLMEIFIEKITSKQFFRK